MACGGTTLPLQSVSVCKRYRVKLFDVLHVSSKVVAKNLCMAVDWYTQIYVVKRITITTKHFGQRIWRSSDEHYGVESNVSFFDSKQGLLTCLLERTTCIKLSKILNWIGLNRLTPSPPSNQRVVNRRRSLVEIGFPVAITKERISFIKISGSKQIWLHVRACFLFSKNKWRLAVFGHADSFLTKLYSEIHTFTSISSYQCLTAKSLVHIWSSSWDGLCEFGTIDRGLT
jgi:hypothetical protein